MTPLTKWFLVGLFASLIIGGIVTAVILLTGSDSSSTPTATATDGSSESEEVADDDTVITGDTQFSFDCSTISNFQTTVHDPEGGSSNTAAGAYNYTAWKGNVVATKNTSGTMYFGRVSDTGTYDTYVPFGLNGTDADIYNVTLDSGTMFSPSGTYTITNSTASPVGTYYVHNTGLFDAAGNIAKVANVVTEGALVRMHWGPRDEDILGMNLHSRAAGTMNAQVFRESSPNVWGLAANIAVADPSFGGGTNITKIESGGNCFAIGGEFIGNAHIFTLNDANVYEEVDIVGDAISTYNSAYYPISRDSNIFMTFAGNSANVANVYFRRANGVFEFVHSHAIPHVRASYPRIVTDNTSAGKTYLLYCDIQYGGASVGNLFFNDLHANGVIEERQSISVSSTNLPGFPMENSARFIPVFVGEGGRSTLFAANCSTVPI